MPLPPSSRSSAKADFLITVELDTEHGTVYHYETRKAQRGSSKRLLRNAAKRAYKKYGRLAAVEVKVIE